ncbi:pilus assembly FimT family protein [Priestia endophytica]|jgi:Tfp pilus assembly protein FimT|nr:hypothetical protein [Priestia endophytica]MED4070728.1 hypothetical protein [Priestia endophytica]RPK15910.1 hypothetical protein FH5_01349 [Priestia endophytica]
MNKFKRLTLKTEQGFSLFGIIVIVFILAIFASFLIPSIGEWFSNQ